MKATIYSHKLKIGTTTLQPGDISMGHVFGVFTPDDAYYGEVQKQVWACMEGDSFWEQMHLNVQLENGCYLYAGGGLSIDDTEGKTDAVQIDIVGVDSWILNDFFSNYPRIFVEEPWQPMEIAQKIAFEKELDLELGINKKRSFFSFLKTRSKHAELDGYSFFAICHHQGNDDVLFRIQKEGAKSMMAVIHLTWTATMENLDLGYPTTWIYKDFDDFKYNRMREDIVDWYD